MPFVERDIYNDVLSVLEDSFVATSVNVCMQLLRSCYWASRRTCSMPTFDRPEEILGDWLSDLHLTQRIRTAYALGHLRPLCSLVLVLVVLYNG